MKYNDRDLAMVKRWNDNATTEAIKIEFNMPSERAVLNRISDLRRLVAGNPAYAKYPRPVHRQITPQNCSEWTDAEENKVVNLWNKGHSASEIGKILKCTKGVVIGRLFRMRKRRNDIIEHVQPEAPAPAPDRRHHKGHIKSEKKKPMEILDDPLGPDPAAGKDYRIQHTNNKACRWPVSEDADGHIFCMRPVAEKSAYCAAHAVKQFNKNVPNIFKAPRARSKSWGYRGGTSGSPLIWD